MNDFYFKSRKFKFLKSYSDGVCYYNVSKPLYVVFDQKLERVHSFSNLGKITSIYVKNNKIESVGISTYFFDFKKYYRFYPNIRIDNIVDYLTEEEYNSKLETYIVFM